MLRPFLRCRFAYVFHVLCSQKDYFIAQPEKGFQSAFNWRSQRKNYLSHFKWMLPMFRIHCEQPHVFNRTLALPVWIMLLFSYRVSYSMSSHRLQSIVLSYAIILFKLNSVYDNLNGLVHQINFKRPQQMLIASVLPHVQLRLNRSRALTQNAFNTFLSQTNTEIPHRHADNWKSKSLNH